jgi:predicted nicotinamide N-methyase
MAAIDGATNLSFIFYHSDEDAHSTMEASVEGLEAPHSDYGLYLWPSGEVLAWYLWKHPEVTTSNPD